MKDLDEHKKIALLIDADNAQHSKIKAVLDEISAHGHCLVRRAYGDWSSESLKNWKNVLNRLAIQAIQQHAYTTGKNSTDMSMVIDAMDLLYSAKLDAFAIVSSDSDFTKLALRLKESEMFVFGFGENKTPIAFKNACDDFIYTENLGEVEDTQASTETSEPDESEDRNGELIKLLELGWQQYQDEEGWANVGPVGSFIKRSKPYFDPRSYGAKKFTDIITLCDDTFEMRRNSTKIVYRPKEKA